MHFNGEHERQIVNLNCALHFMPHTSILSES